MSRTAKLPPVFSPMLATPAPEPFDSKEHLFEVKWDGVRTLAFCEEGETRLYARSGREVTHQYPEFAELHRGLRIRNAVLDGEIVAVNPDGRPSFELLQQRIALTRPADVRRAVSKVPLDLVLFDVVFADGDWIGGLPLADRVERLREVLGFEGHVLRSDAIPEHGVALFEAGAARGLEGIVAKKLTSHYLPGKRTRDWLKIKVIHRISCVVGGWRPGGGSRRGVFGALLVGVYDGDALVFIGSVGTGFDQATLERLSERLRRLESEASPFAGPAPVPDARWIRPEIVCEVEYRELTSGDRLRGPSFKGVRDDLAPTDCRLPA